MELLLKKLPGGMLVPFDDETADELHKAKTGAVLHGEFRRVRNYVFHKRFFALVNVAYDIWTETQKFELEYRGVKVLPNKVRFRKDLTILAGYYEATYNLKGEVRLEAKSISFGSMSQDEFEALFSQFLNVVLAKVLTSTNYTEDQLRARVDEVMRFDR